MIKKSLSLLLLVFICIFSIFAAQTPNQLVIVAYDGVSGIPVGANYFHADTGGVWKWKTKSSSNASSKDYSDTEMIGLIQFYYVEGSSRQNIAMNGTITVTITCPNGFYLTSQSNPNYKRPFEILLSPGDWTTEGSKKVTEDQPTQTFTINVNSRNHVHFDVVISLPGETENSTKECTVTSSTGKTTIYPLDDLSDYSAVVTFDVTYTPTEGEAKSETLTLPFSGYYDSSVKTPSPHTTSNGYDGVSMNIILNSEAYNIDIENKRGTWIPIGDFYFNMMLGQIDEESDTSKKAAIFFSTSENPWDTNAEKFTMVHDDVKTNTPLTTQNSIEFTLRTVNLDKTSEIMTFDGTTYFEKSDGATGSEIDETKYIIPDFTADKMYDYYSDGKSVRGYFNYKGRIEIMLDNNDITMLQGRYTETIYVHVMVYN